MKLVLVIVLASRVATAQPAGSSPSAFSAGLAAYRAGDYATAAAAFEESFRIDARPEIAFTLAQAHRNQYFVDRELGHLHRALGLYRHYLLEAPLGRRADHARLHLETITTILETLPDSTTPAASPPATQLLVTADAPGARASIDGDPPTRVPRLAEVTSGTHSVRIEAAAHDPITVEALAVAERLVVVPATLHPRDGRITVRANGARVEVDGRAANGVTTLTPGSHVLTITQRGHRSVTRVFELAAGGEQVIHATLMPTGQRRAARSTLIGAAGLAGGAIVTGAAAWFAQRNAVALRPPAGHDLDAYNAAVDRRDTWRGISIGLAVGAVATGITGAALYWLDVPAAAELPRVTPIVGPESIGVEARF